MKKLNKKLLNVMATAALVASVAAPFSASAATDYRIGDVPTYDSSESKATLGEITFKDTDFNTDLRPGGTITLTFPSGAKVIEADTQVQVTDATGKLVNLKGYKGGDVTLSGDYTLNLKLPTELNDNAKDSLVITPVVKLESFSGSSVDVDVQNYGAGVPSGKYTLARIIKGKTVVTSIDSKTVGDVTNGLAGTVRIEESSIGTFGDGTITLKLPTGFKWGNKTAATPIGGLDGTLTVTPKADGFGTRTLVLDLKEVKDATVRGAIQLDAYVTVESDAKYGDISLDVTGTDVDSSTITLGTYSDYGIKVEAVDSLKEIFAGRIGKDDKKDTELTEFHVKESVNNSITSGRKTTFEFPSWVKIVKVEVKSDDLNIGEGRGEFETALNNAIEANKIEYSVKPAATGKTEFRLKFFVSVDASKSGEIKLEASGRQGIEGSAILGNASAVVTAEGEATDVSVGIKEQAVGTLLIKESKKGAFIDKGKVRIELPENVKWSNTPVVEVTEGNVGIKKGSVKKDTDDRNRGYVEFEIDGESTTPSTIKVSGGKIDLDRSIPEGSIVAKVKGSALVENHSTTLDSKDDSDNQDERGYFDSSSAAKAVIANVTTPAPGKATVNPVSFVIDSTTYTVNGVEKTIDVAPFIKDGRTFLPIRFVADALGVSENNIIWNDAARTVTLIKGDRIAQIKLGSKDLVVNGVTVPMDVAAFVKDGRTVLPLRYAAQALGADIQWDEATRTVTVN